MPSVQYKHEYLLWPVVINAVGTSLVSNKWNVVRYEYEVESPLMAAHRGQRLDDEDHRLDGK